MADLPNVNVEQIEEFKRLANTDGVLRVGSLIKLGEPL